MRTCRNKTASRLSEITILSSEKRFLRKGMQFKTHPWNDEKCKHVLQGRLKKEGKCRMYRNVSGCIGQKKWSYTCITRKKWSCTCITRKKMELYMYNSKKKRVIHSYTFLYITFFLHVLGYVVLTINVFLGFVFQKMRPHGPQSLT